MCVFKFGVLMYFSSSSSSNLDTSRRVQDVLFKKTQLYALNLGDNYGLQVRQTISPRVQRSVPLGGRLGVQNEHLVHLVNATLNGSVKISGE